MNPTRLTNPLRFGVAGAGVMGRNHARVLSESREADLALIFDPDAVVAEGVAAAYGAQAVTTAEDFVAGGLEAAVVATPNRHHADLSVSLLEAGVHVLVEKPIAADLDGARRIIAAAKANDRVLMVGQVERFNPAVEAVKRAIAGEQVISIQITRVGPFPPRMGEVGVVIDLAVHDIDIIRHLTGSEIVEVQPQLARTRAEREDTALLQFRLENGVIAHITTNWVTPYKTRTLQVATQNKFVVADLMTRQVTEYFGQQPDGSYSTRGVMSWPNEPLKKELEAFAHAIRTGEAPAVTGEDGLKNLEVALRCLGEAG
jgi:UDP-N-acetylglucosamine 3-dehydrogenase